MKMEMHWISQANIVWSALSRLGFVYMCMWMLWIRVWRINMRLVHDLHEAASNEAMSLTAVCGWHWYSDTETVIYAMYTEGLTVVVLAPQRDIWVYIKMKHDFWHQGWMKSVLSVCGISSILIIDCQGCVGWYTLQSERETDFPRETFVSRNDARISYKCTQHMIFSVLLL